MNFRLRFLFAVVLLVSPCAFGQFRDLADTHIAGNVPTATDFRPFLVRDLTTYLTPTQGEGITVDYELLRDGPTQSGVAYPKFYLWVTVTKPDKSTAEGAARVAAIEKKEFQVTDFAPRAEIVAHPENLAAVFPKTLLEKIWSKAGVEFSKPKPPATGQ
jgi:hypothetical protein